MTNQSNAYQLRPTTITEIFTACLAMTEEDLTLDQPCSYDEYGAASNAIGDYEWTVSYHAEFIGTIFTQDGLWHISNKLEGFATDMDAARALLALEAADGHVNI